MLALGAAVALLAGGGGSSPRSAQVAVTTTQTHVTTTIPPVTRTVPTTTTVTAPPRPVGTPRLSIAGKLEYVAPDPSATDSGTVTVTDLGPGPIAIEASVDSDAFVLAPRCPGTLEVGQECVIAITYLGSAGIRSATLRLGDTPSTARLDGMVSTTSSRGGKPPPPVAVQQGVTTQTTTTASPPPGDGGVVVR
jgi:hypothetical protein